MAPIENRVAEGIDNEPLVESGPIIFGIDLSKEPCVRSAGIYSILGGIGAGLVHYVATSNPRKGLHTSIGAVGLIGLSYYVVCGANYVKGQREIRFMQKKLEIIRTTEGTERDPMAAKRRSAVVDTQIDVGKLVVDSDQRDKSANNNNR